METLWALGVALGVPFGALIEPPVPAVQVVRAGEGPTVRSEHSSYTAVLLSASPPGARRDIYRTRLEPGSARESEPHIPGTVEHLTVSTGRVKAGPRGEEAELGPGDYTAFRGEVPHSYEALAPGTAFVLVMQHMEAVHGGNTWRGPKTPRPWREKAGAPAPKGKGLLGYCSQTSSEGHPSIRRA